MCWAAPRCFPKARSTGCLVFSKFAKGLLLSATAPNLCQHKRLSIIIRPGGGTQGPALQLASQSPRQSVTLVILSERSEAKNLRADHTAKVMVRAKILRLRASHLLRMTNLKTTRQERIPYPPAIPALINNFTHRRKIVLRTAEDSGPYILGDTMS